MLPTILFHICPPLFFWSSRLLFYCVQVAAILGMSKWCMIAGMQVLLDPEEGRMGHNGGIMGQGMEPLHKMAVACICDHLHSMMVLGQLCEFLLSVLFMPTESSRRTCYFVFNCWMSCSFLLKSCDFSCHKCSGVRVLSCVCCTTVQECPSCTEGYHMHQMHGHDFCLHKPSSWQIE